MTSDETILSELRGLRNDVAELRTDVQEVLAYIRRIQSNDYINAEDVKQFAINLAANVLVDGMENQQKEKIKSNFKSDIVK